MAQLVSGKDGLTIRGQRFGRGEPIPADVIRGLPQHRVKQMTEQRMVHEDSTRASSKKER